MFHNEDIFIEKIYFDGVKNPKLRITGKYLKKCNLTIKIDGKFYSAYPNLILDKDYVVNKINNIKSNSFDLYIKLPKQGKTMEIYNNNIKILEKDISLLKRIISKIENISIRTLKIIKRTPKIMMKTIKLMWERHHFLIPPRMLKQYLTSFNNNLSNKNIDELFYNPLVDKDYQKWLQEQNTNIEYQELKYKPLISLIIPVYNVSGNLLRECLNSILNQSYNNFEICLADDHSTNKETIEVLKEYEKKYANIKVVYRQKNGHISEASNSALEIATGEFIGLIDNDDILDKDALYYVALELNNNKKLDLIYTDEDKLDFNGNRCFPHFKSDFALDTFLSSNYICHFTVIRKSIIDKLKGFRSEYNGSQDYDLFLRIIDKTRNIKHIPKILYHWRMVEGSTSSKGSNKNYAYEAGKRALEDYFKRNNIKAIVHLIGDPQMYQIEYLYDKEPSISIIIPTKDKASTLDTCLKSIYEKTNYKNYEIIVIDNNSTKEETFALLEDYKNKYDNFNYYTYKCPFNFSYLNNEGVKKAKGDYIVLLNNDTEIISKDWLHNMVGYASRKHIGCVGVKLLYPNRTIQHSGVVIGVGGIAMHACVSTGEDQYGYFGRLVSVYDWSCVTAACLMIKKSKFLEVEGLDENLKVAYNDVDLNLKLLEKGYNNVVIPHVKLFHYESLTRGNDMQEDQIVRFKEETDYMCDKWKKTLLHDKYYNDNLSYHYAFRLDRKKEENEK